MSNGMSDNEQIEKTRRGVGRPNKPQNLQLVNRGISLLPEEWDALARVAEERNITRAALIRLLLEPFFVQHVAKLMQGR